MPLARIETQTSMATMASESPPRCVVCRLDLLNAKQQRLLCPASATTKQAASFLNEYIFSTGTSHDADSSMARIYACRTCFNKLEKGQKAVESLQDTISDLRETAGLPSLLLAIMCKPTDELRAGDRQADLTSPSGFFTAKRPFATTDDPQPKRTRLASSQTSARARRSLSFTRLLWLMLVT